MEPPSPPEAAINLAKATVRGTFWTYASFYTGKLLVFLTTVILARLLVEEDFGVAGYALVVMTFLEVLNDMGVSPALIYYRKDPEATDHRQLLHGEAFVGGVVDVGAAARSGFWRAGNRRAKAREDADSVVDASLR